MKFSSDELIPFSEARSGMSKVIEKVLAGRELVVTRHGKLTVALISAEQLFHFREMERELKAYLSKADAIEEHIELKDARSALMLRIASNKKEST
jgi:prevent-host-death family protein